METKTTAELWREVQSATYSEIWHSVRQAGREILEYNPEAVEVYEVDEAITEQADSLVPAYYSEQVHEWLALGMPEVEDSGMSDGSTFGNITGALFEHYRKELTAVVSEMLAERVELLGAVS